MSHEVDGMLLIKRKHAHVDSKMMLTNEMAEVIIQLHVLTGCDHNCGFYGRGKKSILERTLKNEDARKLLHGCGDMLPISQTVLVNLRQFVIKHVYCSNKKTCSETRVDQWKKMKKKNTQRLIPDEDTVNHICARANYLSFCQRNYHLMLTQ